MRVALILVGLALFAGCGGAGSGAAPSPAISTAPTTAPASTGPASPATSASPSLQPSTPAPSVTTPSVSELTAKQVAAKVAAKQKGAKVIQITEDNDPNDLIGRPNGYTDAAIVSWLDCDGLGADCGATVEVWATPEKAMARAKYIQQALIDNPFLGTEYDFVQGNILLRFPGKLTPSQVAKLNVLGGKPVIL